MLTREVIDPYNLETLSAQMLALGYNFLYTPETPTTMDLAKAHAELCQPMPAVFLTGHQREGIGREGRPWLDKQDASVLLTGLLRIRPDAIPHFADLVALTVCESIRLSTGIETTAIKYPNDLVIQDRKAGGILVLNLYGGQRYLGTSAGIGINVHYTEEELAEYPVDYGATALDLHTTAPNPRQPILTSILDRLKFLPVDADIFQTNLQFQQDQNNLWRDYSAVLSRRVRIESEGKTVIEGMVVDTQIGRGILIENILIGKWFNQFDTKMKVRLLD